MKNKKGMNVLIENVVFTIIVLVFIVLLFSAVTRVGSQATLFEQIYSKQIALIIDKASLGMDIEVDIFEMSEIARKNKFSGNVVSIDNVNKKVNVKLVQGSGYDYNFFSDVEVVWNLGKNDECEKGIRCLKLKILGGQDVK